MMLLYIWRATFEPPTMKQQLLVECHDWTESNNMQINAQKLKTLNLSLWNELTMTRQLNTDNQHAAGDVTNMVLKGWPYGPSSDFHKTYQQCVESCQPKETWSAVTKTSRSKNTATLTLLYKTQRQVIPTINKAAPAWVLFTTQAHKI